MAIITIILGIYEYFRHPNEIEVEVERLKHREEDTFSFMCRIESDLNGLSNIHLQNKQNRNT